MPIAQAQVQDIADESKYIRYNRDTEGEQGSKYNNDRTANNKLAYHGKGGNVSLRPQPGRNFNRPQLESAARFQKSRKKNK